MKIISARVQSLFTSNVHWKMLVVCLTASVLISGCETPGQGAINGAIIGAGIGAIADGSPRGVLQGAGIGAAAGAIAGKVNEDQRRRAYYEDDDYYYGNRSYRRSTPAYPVGRPTSRYGYVRSPYPPNVLVDVRGIPHGARVLDAYTGRPFINP